MDMYTRIGTLVFVVLLLAACGTPPNNQIQVNEIGAEPHERDEITTPINNCGGVSEFKPIFRRSYEVDITGHAELGIDIKALQAKVAGEYSTKWKTEVEVPLAVPPGTNVEYKIAWSMEGWHGTLTTPGQSNQAQYVIHGPVNLELVSVNNLGCHTGGISPTSSPPPSIAGSTGGTLSTPRADSQDTSASQVTTDARDKILGVAISTFADPFITTIGNSIQSEAEGKVKIDIVDSQNSQSMQNEQVNLFLSKKVNVLVVNPVNQASADVISEKANIANVPMVFFNYEPLPEDMKKWDNVFYVGSKVEEAGTLQGQIVVDYWKVHPEADKNKDGKIQYVMLMGEPGHPDTELRTQYSIKAITDAGFQIEELSKDTAMWDRIEAQNKMLTFLLSQGDKIELVLANNDDMALGAIAALEEMGYFAGDKFMPVVGIDATAPAMEALKAKTLIGTILNDAESQGKATVALAMVLAQGQNPSKDNVGYDITDGKYVWIPFQKITTTQ
jgi:methyl-galactoside transport system substrate-binding protein